VLTCLRIARWLPTAGARLAPGLRGFALAGRVSHPLDSELSFKDLPHRPLLSDQDFLVAQGISFPRLECRRPLPVEVVLPEIG